MRMFWEFLTISDFLRHYKDVITPVLPSRDIRNNYLASIIFALQQLSDITDNVNTALADTNIPFDFEPPATPTPTQHGAATTRELPTPVKLITFSMVDMATSPFAHHKTLYPLPDNNDNKTQEPQIRDKVAVLT